MPPLKQIRVRSLWQQELNLIFCYIFRTTVHKGSQISGSWDLIVSRVREISRVLGISVLLWWLGYLASLHMMSQFLWAWLPHSPREINQIARGCYPLRWLNFENCESKPYMNNVLLRIPLYCKFLIIVVPGWRLSVYQHETLSTK